MAGRMNKKEKKAKQFIETVFSSVKDENDAQWVKTANRLLDWFQGRFYTRTERKKRFNVNTTYGLVNLILPNFIFQQPHFRVKPAHPRNFIKEGEGYMSVDVIKAAQKMESLINWHYSQNELIIECRKAIQDSLFYPYGIVKSGLTFELDNKGKVVEDQVFLKRVNPRDFRAHPSATNCDDSPLVAHRIVTSRGKVGKKYNIDDVNSEIPEHIKKKFKEKKKGMLDDLITLFEVHDQENGMIYLFAGQDGKLLEKRENQFNFKGSHFDMIKFAGDIDEFNGIPMLEMVEDEIVAMNDITTLIVEHARKFPGQIFLKKGTIDEDDVERIRTGEQGSIHMVDEPREVHHTPPLMMNNDYFNIVNLLQNFIDRNLGIPDYKRLSGSSRKSATEASFIAGDASVRRNYFLNIVKQFVLSTVEKQSTLLQQFLDEETAVYATGQLDFDPFTMTKSDIPGKYFFDFDVDNMAAMNEAQLNNIINLLQLQAQNPVLQPGLADLDQKKLTKALYKNAGMNVESFSKGDIEEIMYLSPEKEIEILESGRLMPRPNKDEDYDYHLKVHTEYLREKIMQLGPEAAQADPMINQLIEHIAETQALAEGTEQATPMQQQGQPQAQSQQEVMQPAGPTGPMQQIQ